jgi:hypothetical protein
MVISYVKDFWKLKTGEALSVAFLQSKLVDAEKIFAHSIKMRQDIAIIITRLNALKKKAKSPNKTAAEVEDLENALTVAMKDESFRLFSIVESDMLLIHELTAFMHELLKINHELVREKIAQASVKIDLAEINTKKDADKAKKQIDALKKKVDKAGARGQKLTGIKTSAAMHAREIKRMAKDMKRELVSFRNQFDQLARVELRRVKKG